MGTANNQSVCYPYPDDNANDFLDNYPIIAKVNLFLFITGVLYVFVSLSRFYYYQRIYIRLEKRSFLLQLLVSIGVLIQFFGSPLFEATSIVCWIGVVLRSLVVPVTALPIPIRLLDYYNRYVLAETLLNRNRAWSAPQPASKKTYFNMVLKKKMKQQQQNDSNANGNDAITTPAFTDSAQQSLRKIIEVAQTNSIDTANESVASGDKPMSIDNYSNWENDKLIRYLKLLSSTKMRLAIFILMLIPFIIVIIVDFVRIPYLYPSSHCYFCPLSPNLGYLIIVGGALIILLGVCFAFLVRKYPDPFGVVRECRQILQYGAFVALIGFICHRFYPTLTYKQFSFGWVTHVGFFLIQFVSTDFQIRVCQTLKTEKEIAQRLSKSKDKMFQSKIRSDGDQRESIGKIYESEGTVASFESDMNSLTALLILLQDPSERALFEKHLISEFAVENIIMYQEIERFERGFYDMNENTRRARLKKFVDQFVRVDSILQVNIPHDIRKTIIDEFESERPVDLNVFKEAKKELVGMLYGSYLRYIESDIFKKAHGNIGT